MEPKVCPAALLPLISHSFVLSLGGTALLSFGGASRGSLFSDGVVAADVLLGSTMGISFVITRPRGVSIGSYTRGRAFLGAGSGTDLVGVASRLCLPAPFGVWSSVAWFPRCLRDAWSRVGLGLVPDLR